MKQSINTLLETPMQRAEFLKAAGAVLLMMTGIGTIIRALSDNSSHRQSNTQQPRSMYGAQPYGGRHN